MKNKKISFGDRMCSLRENIHEVEKNKENVKST